MDSFPAGIDEKIEYYIYRLIDPRNGETFYIGNGKGDRVFQHVSATKASDVRAITDTVSGEETALDDDSSLKVRRINDIRRAGLQVVHVIHRHGIKDSKTAYEVEAALIDAFPGLSNMSAGHHSNDRGPMHTHEIVDKYALPEVELGAEKLILINVNSADYNSDEELLDRVRYAWRISKARAQEAQYVLAIIHGIVRGVFVPENWLPATHESFPPLRFGEVSSTRLGFHGRKADEVVWTHYVGSRGKRLPEGKRHGQNPVRYHNC